MTMENASKPGPIDPLGCVRQLLQALSEAELDAFENAEPIGPGNRRAAVWLAVALGRCRLFGASPGDYDGTLPPSVALAAAEQCCHDLQGFGKQVGSLSQCWSMGDIDAFCELEAGDILFARMGFWAAFIAIDEAYEACLHAEHAAEARLRPMLERLTSEMDAADDVMHSNLDALCAAASTEMLNNWRALLAEPYRTALPWWLDGTLEAELHRVERVAADWQPWWLSNSAARPGRPAAAVDIETDYALAASGSEAFDPVIHRLASESVRELPDADYRAAWAHFLASAYIGTPHRKDWLGLFVRLAEQVPGIAEDWRERLRRVVELRRYRGWERRCSGETAYSLDPRPIANEGELREWLHALIDPTSSG